MKRILIDDNMVSDFENGNRINTYLEVPDEQPSAISSEYLILELKVDNLAVNSYRLVEEEILPDGKAVVRQEYILAPDIAYSLFLLFKEWDQEND